MKRNSTDGIHTDTDVIQRDRVAWRSIQTRVYKTDTFLYRSRQHVLNGDPVGRSRLGVLYDVPISV